MKKLLKNRRVDDERNETWGNLFRLAFCPVQMLQCGCQEFASFVPAQGAPRIADALAGRGPSCSAHEFKLLPGPHVSA